MFLTTIRELRDSNNNSSVCDGFCSYMGYCDHMTFSLTKLFVQYCKFVDRNGVPKPSTRQASQLMFDYKADALGVITC